ncbi:PQQ-like beta-propeller repeat protein [Candidatus Bathyarchaeota archaeon]|nr:PQQ-like beta-propeller repeat protein [Candidatus Bathyarchaeota archaeon]
MQIPKDKTAIAIALFLTLTIAVSLVSVSSVNAQTVRYWPSFIYVGASPNPVGVGQETVIVIWTADMPPDIGEQSGAVSSPTGRAGWYDMSVQVIKPDGTNQTLEFPYSDPVGANWISWTPTEAGTYVLQAYFTATWKNTTGFGAADTYYEADMSDAMELVVQDEQIQAWQEPPLPNTYWTRPINTGNRLWYPLASNWMGRDAQEWPPGSTASAGGGFGSASSYSNTYNYVYGLGCETPHVLWTRQYAVGGLMDERYDVTGYQTAHYQGLGFSGIILNGVIHYSPRITHAGTQGWAGVNLYTGEELFLDWDVTNPSFASIYDYASGNQHGGFAYLWRTSGVDLPEIVQITRAEPVEPANRLPVRTGTVQTVNLTETSVSMGTVYEMLDGFTGKTVCYIANVSGGTGAYSADGSILRYNIANLGGTRYLQMWNSSHGTMPSSQIGTGAWQWRPAGGTFGGSNAYLGGVAYNYVHDGNDFYSLNVSIPSITGPINARLNETGNILAIREGEYVIIGTGGINDEDGIAPGWMMAVSLEAGSEGQKLWENTWTPPSSAGRQQAATFGASASGFLGVYPEYGVFMYRHQRTQIYYAFSMDTFQQIWQSEPETQFGYYGTSSNVYDGMLYSYGYGGVVYAYNITTGERMWEYAATSEGFESTYGGNYPCGIVIIADGKLYTVTGEHSPTQPLFRGHNLRCLNASTGDEIWKIQGWFGGMSPTSSNIMMADGILVGLNFFDNQLYAFGKGPSATTVTASPEVSVHGSSVMVKGTVTDQSEFGRRDISNSLQFSLKGTPAISDDDMAVWMEYMFMQQAKPADAKGVEVVLTVMDPNSNVYEIGRTTSDVTGAFGFEFEPLVPGMYQIVATFEGSNAYGPSSATTYLSVEEAPAATAEPTPPPASMTDTYVLGLGAGAIIAIIAIGIVIILMLRRR